MSLDSDTTQPRRPSPWKTITVFALVGPLIGCLLGLVTVAPASGKITSLADLASMAFILVPFSYVFGLVPAALTGVAVAWARANNPQVSSARLGAIWGALSAGVAGLAVAWMADGGGLGFAFTVLWFAAMGAAAGFVCGRLLRAAKPDHG
jgi:hypothetical protein